MISNLPPSLATGSSCCMSYFWKLVTASTNSRFRLSSLEESPVIGIKSVEEEILKQDKEELLAIGGGIAILLSLSSSLTTELSAMYVQTSGSMLAILLALIAAGGSVVGTEGKRVAPLIDDDWTKRPHRAAGIYKPRIGENLSDFYQR
ncbi:hypothetical protein KQX54_017122 [Cotesia glomerata]|uniref:Uncharacterized protein n=1 Tax=Cotesia glomerata TaxID=32391 RepID=A0AAV7J2D3_COTGL|nr:hypothetical protein KQX54_017122 [Cotesia glomerata]